MLDLSEVEEVKQLVRELRQRHDRRAQLVERLVEQALAVAPLTPQSGAGEWLSTGEAARLIGVSPQTIKNWVTSGALDGVRLGGRIKVRRHSVMAYVDRLRPSPAPPAHLTEARLGAAKREEDAVMAALPQALRERVEDLMARRAEGVELSPEEQAELKRLVREASTRATAFLAERLPR
ncbi:MAG: helix-turn-helix domain-containing protein [Chloroflexi bacterium]|nr:helix-turn-helix domain-containing protein [Chloroflexota bacterium]